MLVCHEVSVPVFVLLSASILWGLTWLPLKFLHGRGIEGLPLILVSYGAVALLLAPLLWRQRSRWAGGARALGLIFLLGGCANLTFNLALMHGDVVRVMVLFYLMPVWSAVGGRFFLAEAIDRQRLVSVALALVGALLILGGWDILEQPLGWLDLMALVSGLAFALNNIAFRASPALPLASKVGAMFMGCAVLAGLLLVAGVQPDLAASPAWQPAAFGWMALMGLIWFLASLGTLWSVIRLQAGQAGVIMVMELLAAVVSAAWLGESELTALKLAGVGCVLAAALLEALRPGAAGH
ncbi:MAG: DMT family transporter [Gammaproteobacteria bacterium]|nr:DMT family transporter [Gammaproteobacteria bacterium]